MAKYAIGIGQGSYKESVCGNVSMNRYGIFNGVERPRIVDEKHDLNDKDQLHLLGFDAPSSAPVAANLVDIGELTEGPGSFYTYKYIGLCTRHRRPVPVGDATDAYTRSNPSPVSNAVEMGALDRACSVTMDYLPREDISHIGLYRSLTKATSNLAIAGNWFLTCVTTNASTTDGLMTVTDTIPDTELGDYPVETDNWPPNAHPYAAEIDDTIFAIGSRGIGSGLTCQVWAGSWGVLLETAGEKFFDGIRGWKFTILGDASGGIDGLGHYYVRYLTDNLLQLIDENNNPMVYDGAMAGSGNAFVCYIDGHVLRWSKKGEPESWPLTNSLIMRGDGIGIAQIPNQSLLLVCTDRPEMRVFDVNVIASPIFAKSTLISNEFSAYHFSLTEVEGRLRGIDPWQGAIWQTDGSAVANLTQGVLKDIWEYLSTQPVKQKNWHCCYDPHQKIFGAWVTLADSQRYVDFAIIQNLRTGRWFFNHEKDLLCSCRYRDPNTGRVIVLGGTEGLGTTGGTWGRIFTPDHYNDWIYSNTLLSGEIIAGTPNIINVDNTDDDLQTPGDGLKGRWVLVTDADGNNEQVASISANTINTMTVDAVYGGASATQFDPVPEAGWKFYVGLIECKWGPKRFTFDDPAVFKQVMDVYARIAYADADNPPFIRLFRGNTLTYTRQLELSRAQYVDGSDTDSWRSLNEPIEPSLKWGMRLYDRSYEPIRIEDITLKFHQPKE